MSSESCRECAEQLCAGCRAGVERDLTMLPGLYRRCAGHLVGPRHHDLDRVRGGRPGGINLDDAAVTARSDIMSVLASWAGLVADEVGSRPRRDVDDLAAFLIRQLPWLAAHPACQSARREIAGLVAAAERVVGDDLERTLGPCEHPGCAHPLIVTVGGRVGCAAGHQLPPHRWLMFRDRMERVA